MKCPNCNSEEWLEGPSCGGAQNIKCAKCGNRYNLTPFGLDFIGVSKLPYIKNTDTGEVEEFPDISSAIHEAETLNEDIFENTNAPTLADCPHWAAYNEDGILVLDDVPVWRYHHPDRPLCR